MARGATQTCPRPLHGTVPVQLYLEVPRGGLGGVELDLQSLSLVGAEGSVTLTLSRKQLVASELAGRQVLLGTGLVPDRQYDHLRLTLNDVALGAGVARVHPAWPDSGIVIPLAWEGTSSPGSALFLAWRFVPIPEAGADYSPGLHQIFPTIPPLASLAFVSVEAAGLVDLVDPVAGRVVQAVAVGNCPQGLAFLPTRQWLVVALHGEDTLAVVDGLTMRLLRKIPLRFGDKPTRLLVTPDGEGLLVLSHGSFTLTLLGTGSLQEKARVSVGEDPRAMAVDPRTGIIYVTTAGEGVEAFAGSDLHRVPALGVGGEQGEILWGGMKAGIVVGARWRSFLASLDPVTDRVVFRQSLCGSCTGLALGAAAGRFYVTTGSCDEVAVLDTSTGVEFPSLILPEAGSLMGLSSAGRFLLVVLPKTGRLAVFRTLGGGLHTILEVGQAPYAVVAP